jgi:hypothetical protein
MKRLADEAVRGEGRSMMQRAQGRSVETGRAMKRWIERSAAEHASIDETDVCSHLAEDGLRGSDAPSGASQSPGVR